MAISGRPDKYTPVQNLLVNLVLLHQKYSYMSLIKLDNGAILGFRFLRKDGKIINYFLTIRDEESHKEQQYPTFNEWLLNYKNLLAANKISHDDISIVPLLEIHADRYHFNTILVTSHVQQKLHLYLIEPRSSNLMSPIAFYPVDRLRKQLEGVLPEAMFVNLLVGKQALSDLSSCGAQQINFTRVIAGLQTKIFEDSNQLLSLLRITHLSRRAEDNELIYFITPIYERELQKMPEDEHVPLYHLLLTDNFQRILSSEIASIETIASNSLFYELMQAMNEGNSYDPRLLQPLQRGLLTAGLINLFETLKKLKNNDEINYKICVVLYSLYLAINDSSDVLLKKLEPILAKYLDCKLEYKKIINENKLDSSRYKNSKQLFEECMNLYVSSVNGFVHPAHSDVLAKLQSIFVQINQCDKLKPKQSNSIDSHRDVGFLRIFEELGIGDDTDKIITFEL